MSLPPIIGGWYLPVTSIDGILAGFTGGSLDLGKHNLLVAMYSCIVCQLFEFLKELVSIREVCLSELLPLHMLDLCICVLPESCPQLCLEVFIRGVLLFPVRVPSYNPGTQLPPLLSVSFEP